MTKTVTVHGREFEISGNNFRIALDEDVEDRAIEYAAEMLAAMPVTQLASITQDDLDRIADAAEARARDELDRPTDGSTFLSIFEVTTFESLYRALGDDEAVTAEYDRRRAAKVTEIAAYIATYLRDGVDVAATAEWIMANAEEMGRFDGDYINGEVPASLTRDGNPLPLTI